jgi:hypothetical protein
VPKLGNDAENTDLELSSGETKTASIARKRRYSNQEKKLWLDGDPN